MAYPSIPRASFTGFTNLSQSTYTQADIDAKISTFLDYWINNLVGPAFAYELESKTKDRYTLLYTGGSWVNDQSQTVKLNSFSDVLRLLIYSSIIQYQAQTNTSVGTVVNYNENSQLQMGNNVSGLMISRMSEAARLWQSSICPFLDKYREVSQEIAAYSGLGGGDYRFTVSETTYLEVDDTVTINGEDYTVLAVTDTTFDLTIDPTPAAQAVNSNVTWEPFGLVINPIPSIKVAAF